MVSIEFGLQYVARHPNKDNNTHPHPHFGTSLCSNHILLNNAAASQTSIGWHNLRKGRICKEWAKAMGPQLAIICEFATLKALWNHSYRLWVFRNNEDHKNYNRAIVEYE
jgi:hypothetical protein